MFEYLLLAEELGAAPVWVANNGISHQQSVAVQDVGPWIQSALDSLEFAMGGQWTPWGAVRKQMGHPAPFNISHFAIGNEVGVLHVHVGIRRTVSGKCLVGASLLSGLELVCRTATQPGQCVYTSWCFAGGFCCCNIVQAQVNCSVEQAGHGFTATTAFGP